jgi:hypothetical protein
VEGPHDPLAPSEASEVSDPEGTAISVNVKNLCARDRILQVSLQCVPKKADGGIETRGLDHVVVKARGHRVEWGC